MDEFRIGWSKEGLDGGGDWYLTNCRQLASESQLPCVIEANSGAWRKQIVRNPHPTAQIRLGSAPVEEGGP